MTEHGCPAHLGPKLSLGRDSLNGLFAADEVIERGPELGEPKDLERFATREF